MFDSIVFNYNNYTHIIDNFIIYSLDSDSDTNLELLLTICLNYCDHIKINENYFQYNTRFREQKLERILDND